MELALGRYGIDGLGLPVQSFNPCFLGTCPRTKFLINKEGGKPSFNPCFLGTCPRTSVVFTNPDGSLSFNPCFLGTCPRTFQHMGNKTGIWVSILVFLELALGQRESRLQAIPRQVSILVFLELALGPRVGAPGKPHPRSFNPCFLGTCPRTTSSVVSIGAPCGFQSLFSWNLPSDFDGRFMYFAAFKFQSLFSWNLPSDLIFSLHMPPRARVSILVFLELALGP